jgi:hypothetical protein
LGRKLRGPMADWDLHALLLRLIDLDIRGLQWQNGGGKGSKPKPIDLPDGKGKPKASDGAAIAKRLQNLGQIASDVVI